MPTSNLHLAMVVRAYEAEAALASRIKISPSSIDEPVVCRVWDAHPDL